MNTYADRRDARRIVVGPDFAISFILKGHRYQDVRITNLSTQGCFALVGVQSAGRFERGAVLEELILSHPDLPKAPIIAAVSYVLASRPSAEPLEMVGIGIQFLSVDDLARKTLDAWVDAAMTTPRE